MDREKTWRFDLYKMGAKSYGSARPFGGEPQPLKEIKLEPRYRIWSYVEVWSDILSPVFIVERRSQSDTEASITQKSFRYRGEAEEQMIKWKKRDGVNGNISDSKPDVPGSSPGHSANRNMPDYV